MKQLDFTQDKENEYRKNIIRALKADALPVVLYGAGFFGKYAAELVLNNNIPVLCFLDQEQYWTPGKTVSINGREIPCLNKIQLSEITRPYNLLLGLIDYSLLEEVRLIFNHCNLVEYLDAVPNHKMSRLFLEENRKSLEELYINLCDKESQDVLTAYLYGRYTGNVAALSALKHDSTYLYDWKLLELSKNDIVVDGGAYIGDSIMEMENYLNGLPQKIFAFEPDVTNQEAFRKNFSPKQLNNICLVASGLYNCDGALSFSETGTQQASITESGETIVPVQAIDEHTEYKSVSVIKMDIEGSELDALHGCEKLILSNKPRLAICIYHNNQDIIEVYEYLKQFGYKFYLRQHSSSLTETVLYAIMP